MRDLAFLETGIRDSKEYGSGIRDVFMDGTRDLKLLRSGIREIVTLKLRDPGFLTARYLK